METITAPLTQIKDQQTQDLHESHTQDLSVEHIHSFAEDIEELEEAAETDIEELRTQVRRAVAAAAEMIGVEREKIAERLNHFVQSITEQDLRSMESGDEEANKSLFARIKEFFKPIAVHADELGNAKLENHPDDGGAQ